MLPEITTASCGNDTETAIAQVPQKSWVRLLEMNDDRGCIGSVYLAYGLIRASFDAHHFALQNRIERVLHIGRRQHTTIVKMYTTAQMKNIRQRVGRIPSLCKPGLKIEARILTYQRIEDERVDALRLSIHADT